MCVPILSSNVSVHLPLWQLHRTCTVLEVPTGRSTGAVDGGDFVMGVIALQDGSSRGAIRRGQTLDSMSPPTFDGNTVTASVPAVGTFTAPRLTVP